MKRIMTRAWEIAKEGQRNFGGKVSEYFSNGENLGYYEFDKNGFFKSYKGLNTFDENIYAEFMFAIERKLLERNNWMKQQAAA